MPSLISAKQLEHAWDPGFCYLCGRAWSDGDACNRDHVPNKSIFANGDRNPPLILRVHECCNTFHSSEDEAIGQLVSLLHRDNPTSRDARKLNAFPYYHAETGEMAAVVEGLPLWRIIARWVRGFHAALYREPLPSYDGAVYPPFAGTDDLEVIPPIDRIVPKFVELMKRNRAAGTLDRIVCFNRKCRYECVWTRLDDGRSMCVWALDINDWKRLGETPLHPARSCTGYYTFATPVTTAHATQLAFPIENKDVLDAFGT
jgi:hypothetical protein